MTLYPGTLGEESALGINLGEIFIFWAVLY